MGRNHLCQQTAPEGPVHLLAGTCDPARPSGLSSGFPELSPSDRQLGYVLLARPPRYSPEGFHVRLACLIHAANVRSEPGSNPSLDVSSERQGSLGLSLTRTSTQPRGHALARAACPACSNFRWRIRASKSSHAFFRGHPECQRSAASGAWEHRRGRETVATDAFSSSPAGAFFRPESAAA